MNFKSIVVQNCFINDFATVIATIKLIEMCSGHVDSVPCVRVVKICVKSFYVYLSLVIFGKSKFRKFYHTIS